MKKLCAIMIMLLAISGSVYAQVNVVGTVINNQASITAGNIPAAILGNISSATVARMGGAAYTVIPSDRNGAAGGTVYLDFTFANYGNGGDTFGISLLSRQSNGFTVDDTPWTYSIVNMADAGITESTKLAPAGTFPYRIKVLIPMTADDADYMEFRVAVTSLSNAAALTYLDDTGYWWGRSIAFDWTGTRNATPGLLQHSATNGAAIGTLLGNDWVRVAITGPVLSISKWISEVSMNSVAGSQPLPGAIITWTIRITNDGTSAATNIIVRDTRQGSTTFVGQTPGAYLTADAPADPSYSWSGVHLPAKSADTVTFRVRIQ